MSHWLQKQFLLRSARAFQPYCSWTVGRWGICKNILLELMEETLGTSLSQKVRTSKKVCFLYLIATNAGQLHQWRKSQLREQVKPPRGTENVTKITILKVRFVLIFCVTRKSCYKIHIFRSKHRTANNVGHFFKWNILAVLCLLNEQD